MLNTAPGMSVPSPMFMPPRTLTRESEAVRNFERLGSGLSAENVAAREEDASSTIAEAGAGWAALAARKVRIAVEHREAEVQTPPTFGRHPGGSQDQRGEGFAPFRKPKNSNAC